MLDKVKLIVIIGFDNMDSHCAIVVKTRISMGNSKGGIFYIE